MTIVKQFNDAIDRELSKLTKEQEISIDQAMSQFDQLVKSGAVEPERYKIEPIGTVPFRFNQNR